MIIHCWIPPQLDELSHGRMGVIGLTHIGLLPPRHVHRDQRIAVDISLPDDLLFRIAGEESDRDSTESHCRNEECDQFLFHNTGIARLTPIVRLMAALTVLCLTGCFLSHSTCSLCCSFDFEVAFYYRDDRLPLSWPILVLGCARDRYVPDRVEFVEKIQQPSNLSRVALRSLGAATANTRSQVDGIEVEFGKRLAIECDGQMRLAVVFGKIGDILRNAASHM